MRPPTTRFPLVLFPAAGEPLGADEVSALAEALRAELASVEDIQVDEPAPAPPDARFVAEIGAALELVITAGQTAEILTKLIRAMARWRRRHADRIALEVAGVAVTEEASTVDRIVERLVGAPAVRSSGPIGARRALVIANLAYEDSALRGLRAPADDARALQRVLGDPRIGGFDVEMCVDATDAVLRRRISDFFGESSPDDLLLVHYSGHGMKDGRGRLYLAASDTEVRRLAATGVPASFLNDQMSDSPSRRIVLVLDCCYSGAFTRGSNVRADRSVHVAEEFGGEGRVVLTASSATEYAFEGDAVSESHGQPSVFTSALVRGLETGEADIDGDGDISIDELYDFVYREVVRTQPGQVPHKWSFGVEGSLVIARSVRPVRLPDAILDDLASDRVSLRLDAVDDLARVYRRGSAALRDVAAARLHRLREEDDSARVRTAAARALGAEPVSATPPSAEEMPAAMPVAEPALPAAPPEAIREPQPDLASEPGRAPKSEPEPVVTLDSSTLDKPPRRSRRALVAVSAAVALLIVVVGTAYAVSKQSGEPDNSSSGSRQPIRAGFDLGLTSILNPSTAKGGTVRLGSSGTFDSYDPAGMYHNWEFNFSRLYLRTLVTAAPGPGPVRLVGDLAQDWTVSADRRTYTFRLRPGVKFEDGTSITSSDIKYGIERAFDPSYLGWGPLLASALDGGQGYKGPVADQDPAKLGLKSVQTPDVLTIVFSLPKPDADFLHLLATPASAPVPRAHDTGTTYGEHVVASGPYRIAKLVKDKQIDLVRNEKWDSSTDPNRTALPDGFSLTMALDQDLLDKGLLAGDYDLDVAQAGLAPPVRDRALADPAVKPYIDQPYNSAAAFLAVNQQVKPLDNIHCREAVAYAIDRARILRADPSLTGFEPAGVLLAPNVAGHDAALDPFGTLSGGPSVGKANESLTACGKAGGFTTKLAVRDLAPSKAIAEAIQAALQAAGIRVSLLPIAPADYYRRIGDPTYARNNGIGLMLAGRMPDVPTGASALSPLVTDPLGGNNFGRVNDPQIAFLAQRAAGEDLETAAATWRQIDADVVKSAVYVPLYYYRLANYRNPRLTNVYVDSFPGMVDLRSIGTGSSS